MEKGLPKPGFARVLGERDREKNERMRGGRFLLALNGSEDNSSNRTGLGKRGKKKEKGKKLCSNSYLYFTKVRTKVSFSFFCFAQILFHGAFLSAFVFLLARNEK